MCGFMALYKLVFNLTLTLTKYDTFKIITADASHVIVKQDVHKLVLFSWPEFYSNFI